VPPAVPSVAHSSVPSAEKAVNTTRVCTVTKSAKIARPALRPGAKIGRWNGALSCAVAFPKLSVHVEIQAPLVRPNVTG
jgi:hypothetical protein